MSEREVIEGLDRIQNLCSQVVNPMVLAKRQGRMLSLEEAKTMDGLSQELLDCTREVSRFPMSRIASPELRCRADVLINLAKNALKLIVYSETVPAKPRPNRIPPAASSRLNAYAIAS